MTVYEFLHTADKNQIARFLFSLLCNCECGGECPLWKIAKFGTGFYGCRFDNIFKWLDENMIGGIDNAND